MNKLRLLAVFLLVSMLVSAWGPTPNHSNPKPVTINSGGEIVNLLSMKCLDPVGSPGTANGTRIQLGDCNGSADQLWEITNDGFYRNYASGRCLDVSGPQGVNNGSPLQLWDCETSATTTDQRWSMNKMGFLINMLSGRCADVAGNGTTTSGAPLNLWDCETGSPSTTDQRWAFRVSSAVPSGGTTSSSPCIFSASSSAYGAKGDTTALIRNGYVDVSTPSIYSTTYTVEVGVWVDDYLAALASDIPTLVLSYFEHANCIFAKGLNADSKTGVHEMSLRIAGNRIRYYRQTTPQIPGENGIWLQQAHVDWARAISALGTYAPKVNILFSASPYVDTDKAWVDSNGNVTKWSHNVSASNGIGQGQALVAVNPTFFRNGDGKRPFNQDWWGDIAAHELGHALGTGQHLAIKFATMCCKPPADYPTEVGFTESYKFSLEKTIWDDIVRNNASTTDNYPDPYSTIKNPVTREFWSFPQIHNFLKSSANTSPAFTWVQTLRYVKTALIGNGVIFVTDDSAGNMYQYSGTPNVWNQIGNSAMMFALDGNNQLYAIASDGKSIWQWAGNGMNWNQVGTSSSAIYAGGNNLFSVDPSTGDIWHYEGTKFKWTRIGGPGRSFTVGSEDGILYGLSLDGLQIFWWDQQGNTWKSMVTFRKPLSAIYALAGGKNLVAFDSASGEVYMHSSGQSTFPWVNYQMNGIASGNAGVIGIDAVDSMVIQYLGGADNSWQSTWGKAEAVFGNRSQDPVCLRETKNHTLWCTFPAK